MARTILKDVNIINQSSPGANTDIGNADVTVTAEGNAGVRLWLSCGFDNATVLKAHVSNSGAGAGTIEVLLNGGAQLEAGAWYTFELPVVVGDNISWQGDPDPGAVRRLVIQSVYDGSD